MSITDYGMISKRAHTWNLHWKIANLKVAITLYFPIWKQWVLAALGGFYHCPLVGQRAREMVLSTM